VDEAAHARVGLLRVRMPGYPLSRRPVRREGTMGSSAEDRLSRVRRFVDDSLIYYAVARRNIIERHLEANQDPDEVLPAMYPLAHIIALLEADTDIDTKEALRRREGVVHRYLTNAKERRIDWTPEGGVVD